MNQFYGDYMPLIQKPKQATMVRGAMSLNETVNSTLRILWASFNRAYLTNKAPLILTLSYDFLTMIDGGGSVSALDSFIHDTLELADVHYVTMAQLLAWLRSPVPNSRIDHQYAPFQCRHNNDGRREPKGLSCDRANVCQYRTPGLTSTEHQFQTCAQCPPSYPWLDNVDGT